MKNEGTRNMNRYAKLTVRVKRTDSYESATAKECDRETWNPGVKDINYHVSQSIIDLHKWLKQGQIDDSNASTSAEWELSFRETGILLTSSSYSARDQVDMWLSLLVDIFEFHGNHKRFPRETFDVRNYPLLSREHFAEKDLLNSSRLINRVIVIIIKSRTELVVGSTLS